MRRVALAVLILLFCSCPVWPQGRVLSSSPGSAVAQDEIRPLFASVALPPAVTSAFENSTVGIFVYHDPTVPDYFDFDSCGVGIVVAERLVLTRYHVLDLKNKLKKAELTALTVKIVSKNIIYAAKVVYFERTTDLALLAVASGSGAFLGKPVTISKFLLNRKKKTGPFFTFGFLDIYNVPSYAVHDSFVRYKNMIGLPVGARGLLNVKIKEGFSGSPVIDENGVIYGSVYGILYALPQTIFTPTDTISGFLLRARSFLGRYGYYFSLPASR